MTLELDIAAKEEIELFGDHDAIIVIRGIIDHFKSELNGILDFDCEEDEKIPMIGRLIDQCRKSFSRLMSALEKTQMSSAADRAKFQAIVDTILFSLTRRALNMNLEIDQGAFLSPDETAFSNRLAEGLDSWTWPPQKRQ